MDVNSSPFRMLLTTFPDLAQARSAAELIVTRQLAACVNILPQMTSVYRWQGQLEQGEEHLLLIKTRQSRLEALQKTLLEIHPYELPEIIVVPLTGGYEPYLNWITKSVEQE